MPHSPRAIDVTIMDRAYRVQCPEEEEAELLEAVAYLDAKMREIKAAGKLTGGERIAVMAALNITHELLTTKVAGGFDIGGLRRRIGDMRATLDQAMSTQEDLF